MHPFRPHPLLRSLPSSCLSPSSSRLHPPSRRRRHPLASLLSPLFPSQRVLPPFRLPPAVLHQVLYILLLSCFSLCFTTDFGNILLSFVYVLSPSIPSDYVSAGSVLGISSGIHLRPPSLRFSPSFRSLTSYFIELCLRASARSPPSPSGLSKFIPTLYARLVSFLFYPTTICFCTRPFLVYYRVYRFISLFHCFPISSCPHEGLAQFECVKSEALRVR